MPDRSGDAAAYARWKRRLLLIETGLTGLLTLFFLFSGWAFLLQEWVLARLPGPWALQVTVYGSVCWAATALFSFPLDWFGSFLLEHRFSLSTQKFPQWLVDYAKHLGLGAVFGLVLVESLSLILRLSPQGWWLWATLFYVGLSVFMARVLPIWLIPIFYRQKPLADENLRSRLSAFVAGCGTRVAGIYEINLSRTTKKANACLCGLGKTRRVLISDTLINSYPVEEVEVVLAHEIGHHRLHHIPILILTSAAAAAASFSAVDWAARRFFFRLAIGDLSDLAALPLIGLGLFIANILLLPATNGISRFLEKQADRFALRKTRNPQAFIAAMRRLAEQNLSELQPPRWVEWVYYDHPPIAKRIAMAEIFQGAG